MRQNTSQIQPDRERERGRGSGLPLRKCSIYSRIGTFSCRIQSNPDLVLPDPAGSRPSLCRIRTFSWGINTSPNLFLRDQYESEPFLVGSIRIRTFSCRINTNPNLFFLNPVGFRPFQCRIMSNPDPFLPESIKFILWSTDTLWTQKQNSVIETDHHRGSQIVKKFKVEI